MKIRQTSAVAIIILFAACVTAPPAGPANWNANATANSAFRGAGASLTAHSNAGGTSISIAFREAAGMSGTVRPWHIHYGTCGNDQGIVGEPTAYPPLRPGADGTVRTNATISVPLDPTRSYFLNIHKSPTELQTIVACAPLSM